MAIPFPVVKWFVRSGVARWLPSVRRRLGPSAAALRYVSDRWLATPFDQLLAAAEFWQADAPDAIDLALGAPRLDLAPSGAAKLPNGLRGYPPFEGLPELRALIAGDTGHDVLITAGATGAFHTILDTYLNPGDRVVLFDPSSPLFSLSLRQRRARLRWVPTKVEGGVTKFAMEPFTKALANAKMLVVANPANPTGAPFAADDLEQIAYWCSKSGVLVVNDESFIRYRDDSAPTDLPMAKGRTLTIGSMSKGHGLAAARVGWVRGDTAFVKPCMLAATLAKPFVPTPMQTLAAAAIKLGDASFAPVRDEMTSKRRYAFERLKAVGLEPAWPSGGFTLWTPVSSLGMTGREFAEELLKTKRVLVTPGDVYGPCGAGFVRVSCAIDDGRLREGLSRLAEFVGERSRRSASGVPETTAAAA
ncbi:MAG: pyridoxal phosphate-dependent aminotransferase [Gemmataceae bacterium]